MDSTIIIISVKGRSGTHLSSMEALTFESFFRKDPKEIFGGYEKKFIHTLKIGGKGLNLITKRRLKSNEFVKYKNTKMHEYLISL